MRILIIDDDEDTRELLRLIVDSQGHEVAVASDGAEALVQVQVGSRPDLIVLDMMMPNLDGEGFMRALKGHPDLAQVPVFVVSGHHAARQKASEIGASGCFVKPVELADLLAVIEEVQAKRSGAGA
jgi:CheY-like chemotaxis protein